MNCDICGRRDCPYTTPKTLYPTYTPYTFTTTTTGRKPVAIAKDDRVEVKFTGKVVSDDSIKSFFNSSYGDSSDAWTGIADEETGVVHLFWKYGNPAKLTEPTNWPPQNHDVWKIGAYTWHAFIDGKLRTSTGSYSYDAKDVLTNHGNGKAELLYRKAS